MCIAGYPTKCPNSDRNDCEDLYYSLRYSYNQNIDGCDEIMSLGLADMSHMSIFNDFDETDDDYHGGIIMDKFPMITVDSAPAYNHKCTLGTGTNDLGNDTRAHTTSYSGQVEGACGLFGNSTDTGRVLRMKLILIVTLVWLRMNLSEWVRTHINWMLLAMTIHVSH